MFLLELLIFLNKRAFSNSFLLCIIIFLLKLVEPFRDEEIFNNLFIFNSSELGF